MSIFRKNKQTKGRNPNLVERTATKRSSTTYYRPVRPMSGPKTSNGESLKGKSHADDTSKKKLSLARVGNYAIVAIFTTLIFFATTLSSTPKIKVVSGESYYRSTEEYVQKSASILSESIVNRSKLLFRSSNFEAQLSEAFPEISSASASIPLGGRDLDVRVVISKPFAKLSSGAQTGVVSSNGVIVAESLSRPTDSSVPNIRFTTPQENFSVGSRVLTVDEVALVSLLYAEFSEFEVAGERLEIDEVLFNVGDGQMDVLFKDTSFILRLSSFGPAEQQVGSALATLSEFLSGEGSSASLPKRYIDVRVPGRVFVL